MPETAAFLVERLKTEGEKTAAFFSSLTDDQWKLAVYTEGETWTVRDMLAHFVTTERELLTLFIDVHNGGAGASENFDIDGFNASQQKITRALSPGELLEHFSVVRAEMMAFVSGLSESDLEKQGRHPRLGITTLAGMIKLIYRHNQVHRRDLRQILPDQIPNTDN
jgi:hypothetical protein